MATTNEKELCPKKRIIKRLFDFSLAFIGLMLTGWLILIAWMIASIETRSNGFFLQKRIGRYGKIFTVIKIKTMHDAQTNASKTTTVTTAEDTRITRSGAILRKSKIDELPQLFNVLLGQMSFVGPRPDVSGYADKLNKNDRIILSLRPGVTGPATLKYRNEEVILATKENPEKYNREVIYPDKVLINKKYIENYSFFLDFHYIIKTLIH